MEKGALTNGAAGAHGPDTLDARSELLLAAMVLPGAWAVVDKVKGRNDAPGR